MNWRQIAFDAVSPSGTHVIRRGDSRNVQALRSARQENNVEKFACRFRNLRRQYPINLPHEELDVAAGKVPGRFLLGKAFFVYWPAGFAPITGFPAIIPNFGDMRFIH